MANFRVLLLLVATTMVVYADPTAPKTLAEMVAKIQAGTFNNNV